jgi:hypothetical protein
MSGSGNEFKAVCRLKYVFADGETLVIEQPIVEISCFSSWLEDMLQRELEAVR